MQCLYRLPRLTYGSKTSIVWSNLNGFCCKMYLKQTLRVSLQKTSVTLLDLLYKNPTLSSLSAAKETVEDDDDELPTVL